MAISSWKSYKGRMGIGNIKKLMLLIWFVGFIVWVPMTFYNFNVDDMAYAYRVHDKFAEKVARGRSEDPLRWDYNLRGYNRARNLVDEANKNLGLFILFGFALPGVILSIGTAALQNLGKQSKSPRKKPG